jgi:hypothetical protein
MADVPPSALRQYRATMHNLLHATALLPCRITMHHPLRATALVPCRTTTHHPLHATAHPQCRITMHHLLRATALLPCRTTTHHPLHATAHPQCRITMHHLLHGTAAVAAGILLRTAIAAAERHDSSHGMCAETILAPRLGFDHHRFTDGRAGRCGAQKSDRHLMRPCSPSNTREAEAVACGGSGPVVWAGRKNSPRYPAKIPAAQQGPSIERAECRSKPRSHLNQRAQSISGARRSSHCRLRLLSKLFLEIFPKSWKMLGIDDNLFAIGKDDPSLVFLNLYVRNRI